MNFRIKLFLFIFLVVCSQSGSVFAQAVQKNRNQVADSSYIINFVPEGEWDLFGREDMVDLTLKFDMRKYLKYVKEPEYQNAVLQFHVGDSTVEENVRIKQRGIFRRGYCTFPPMKLSVKNTKFDNDYLDQQTSFKIVTHCKRSNVYEKYLLKEFLVYKMYNQLTDLSFRVRLVRMQYVDMPPENKKQRKTIEKLGFIIEPLQSVAERNNMLVLKLEHLGQKSINKDYMALVAMFEFMIGNTDWSVNGLRNIKIIKSKEINDPLPYPLPYDFDYSGLVNTDYAVPAEKFGIKSVAERFYLGVCYPEKFVQKARNKCLEKKAAIYKVIDNCTTIDTRDKNEMKRYLDGFYTIIESDHSLKREIIDACLEKF